MSETIVIIGGGHCGASAALAAREAGFVGEIILLCKESEMPYERPPLSKWDGELYRPIFVEDRFSEAGIEVRVNSTVVEIDITTKKVILDSRETQSYTRLLIATGAGVRKISEEPQENIYYLRSIEDARALKERITKARPVKAALIGGGFIGLELAASIVRIGGKVVVLEGSDNLLSRVLPQEISSVVKLLHEEHGVRIRTNALVTQVTSKEDKVIVGLADGNNEEVDLVVVGIGSKPKTKLAKLLKLDCENGIVVDRRFSTEIEGIYAAGDVCVYPDEGGKQIRYESWQVAGQQGVAAGKNLAGVAATWEDVPYFWSDQYEHTLQMFGQADPDEFTVVRKIEDDKLLLFALNSEGEVKAVVGMGEGSSIAKDMGYSRKLIARGVKIKDINDLSDKNIPIKKLLK